MINFLRYRTVSYSVLAFIILSFTGLYIYRGFNYSVDFTGGTQVVVRFSKPVSLGQVRDLLRQEDWKGVVVSDFDKNEARIRIQDVSVESIGLGEKIKNILQKGLPDTGVELMQSEQVSSSIGKTLVWNALKAVFFALIAMLIYIFIRFRFSFAVGAIVALMHDVLAVLMVFLLLNWEISLDAIAALLIIVGYSVNDTIVIFARIREHLQEAGKYESLEHIVNQAINSTLRRTLLTSFSTLLAVASLLIIGGETLRSLSFALLLGIIFGTYSSIFIASPIMLMLYKGKKHGEKGEPVVVSQ
ncbi:TPA: protein translocase subunit SecF [Candidatus Dependentiae bacterium]|nr:MAG: Protein translocase subunit SecF [candidate division TM6 bacterium GW2011_GWF2_36_131]KKQ03831.1 MAG: Protein translocase subunit SecF [candidate division TM6 bacterium GW2011_GWE2_36_25]KKQ19977.1 MAG: Protein translocase subunit SecF [candidate division TM6 bacterium GW2011_GWA2_36_9]HBR70599.1 protein translocase subunit SecF [Candidatus Dependentiae bacterium]HCU00686.1 protein translocase subunit SecF [Candidatus Dependentiae bacterium]